jgi:hypothetical protein
MDIFEEQIIVPSINESITLASTISLTLYPIEFDSMDTILVTTNEYF